MPTHHPNCMFDYRPTRLSPCVCLLYFKISIPIIPKASIFSQLNNHTFLYFFSTLQDIKQVVPHPTILQQKLTTFLVLIVDIVGICIY